MSDDLSRLSAAVARDPAGSAWVALADALRRANRPADAERTALRGLEPHPYCADGHDVRALAATLFRIGEEASNAVEQLQMGEWETWWSISTTPHLRFPPVVTKA